MLVYQRVTLITGICIGPQAATGELYLSRCPGVCHSCLGHVFPRCENDPTNSLSKSIASIASIAHLVPISVFSRSLSQLATLMVKMVCHDFSRVSVFGPGPAGPEAR